MSLARRVLLIWTWSASALVALGAGSAAQEWLHFDLPLTEVAWESEPSPAALQQVDDALRYAWGPPPLRVVLAGGGEAFVHLGPGRPGENGVRLAARAAAGGALEGTLFLEYRAGPDPLRLDFRLDPGAARPEAEGVFVAARGAHHAYLVRAGVAGAAWFRHSMGEEGAAAARAQAERDFLHSDPLLESFDLLAGGRAVSENLQLDRLLPVTGRPDEAGEPVAIDTIPGIEVREHDWAALLDEAARAADLDPLLSFVPADQHAILAPHLGALLELFDELERAGAPLLATFEPARADALGRARAEERLGFPLSELAPLAGPEHVRGVALTGGDLEFGMGTDLALLLEGRGAASLARHVRERQARLLASDPDLERIEAEGLEGVRSIAGGRSSYLALRGDVLVLSTSRAGLLRVLAAPEGGSLADLDETRFLRRRYAPRADESAFLLLSDAAIRRWCGPRWRIASSRRVRARAALLELHARHAPELAGGAPQARELEAGEEHAWLGALTLGPEGVRSSRYGSLAHPTPIVELECEEATAEEARLYGQWREGYQQNWSGAFDPIAAQIIVDPSRVEADLTVMPLIDNSDYGDLRGWTGGARLGARDGDPHPGAILHFALALDPDAPSVRGLQGLLAGQAPEDVAGMLGWMSGALSFAVGESELWDALLEAERPSEAFEDLLVDLNDLPLLLTVGSRSGLRLATWMSALRAFVEGSAPGLTRWTTVDETSEQPFVRVGAPSLSPGDEHVYYATLAEALVLSTNAEAVRGSIARHAERRATPPAADEPSPWLGQSAALRLTRRGLVLVHALAGEAFPESARDQSFECLPILNEWRRLFPSEDPVVVHARVLGEELRCAVGGRFQWNEEWRTMESSVAGHPGAPRELARSLPGAWAELESLEAGVTLEQDGLRARLRALR